MPEKQLNTSSWGGAGSAGRGAPQGHAQAEAKCRQVILTSGSLGTLADMVTLGRAGWPRRYFVLSQGVS